MLRVELRIQGVSPLLQNRMPESTLMQLWSKEKRQTTNQSRPETPRHDAARKVYVHERIDAQTGEVREVNFVPGTMFMSCLIGAGSFMKLDGKRQLSTAKSSLLPGMLSLEQTEFDLITPGWEVDMQQGRSPNGGEAVCIVRPRFDQWAFDASVVIDNDQLPETRFRELFDIAGSRVGIGDFRPARKGTFGRWVVATWKAEKLAA